jgi:hypothetical protein
VHWNNINDVSSQRPNKRRKYSALITLLSVFAVVTALASCTSIDDMEPTDSTPPITDLVPDTTSLEFRDPSVPISGGTGLPDSGSTSSEEVDCEQAEELCDSGDWACDDIADYCDIGPDDGSELPDDWDWDR